MFEVLDIKEDVTHTRVGTVNVRYYDLIISCDICVYKREKLWVRMPEIWIKKDKKISFNRWISREKSDEFQEIVLKKVFDVVGWDLKKCIDLMSKKKQLTKPRKKFTFK